jgi:hypothetical protein
MSSVAATIDGAGIHAGHDAHQEHHHHETFISKYVFSQDHKMIAKQFLVTGMIWAFMRRFVFCAFPYSIGISRCYLSLAAGLYLAIGQKGVN